MRLFRTTQIQRPNKPLEYPVGICVETEKTRYFIHRDGKKYPIGSDEVYRSWKFPSTAIGSEISVSKYPTALTKLGFRDGTLIYNIKDAKMYLISAGVRRHVVSPAAIERIGLKPADAMVVSNADVNLMKLGEEIG